MLEINHEKTNSPTNVNRYSYYNQADNPENMTYEHRVIKEPTISQRTEMNDGI